MRKKIFNILALFLLSFTLFACGEVEETPITPDNPVINGDENEDGSGGGDGGEIIGPPKVEDVEYVVSLVYNKKIYIPIDGEVINVIWVDDYTQHTQQLNEEGYAKIKLDGEFNVYLDKTPNGYTYNPNIYNVDNENSVIEIELLKLSKISRGNGTALYKEYEMTTTGTYRTELKSNTQKVYYEYQPTKAGYYVIESLVNIYADIINPKIDIHNGHSQYKSEKPDETLDGGGVYKKGGYTKNFKWIVKLAEEQLNSVFTFAVYAESKTGIYPITVDFTISYEGEYYLETTISKLMIAEEANFITPDFSSSEYIYINSDGGTGSYYNSVTNGTGLLDGARYKYNEETGYWHVYDVATNTFGPILCAKITKPCAYYDESLNKIESYGNKNLTVSKGTENYKQFIEVQYAAACNSDGVCYVTMELMQFLQKFSVSQRLFFDGNGFVESTGVYAIEEDQWLFACGYYMEK